MSGRLVILRPDGSKEHRLYNDDEPPLEDVQQAVEGYIEPIAVRYDHRTCMAFVNEDGIALGLELNWLATKMCAHGLKRPLAGTIVIVIPDERARYIH
jgi:hypothetical protein